MHCSIISYYIKCPLLLFVASKHLRNVVATQMPRVWVLFKLTRTDFVSRDLFYLLGAPASLLWARNQIKNITASFGVSLRVQLFITALAGAQHLASIRQSGILSAGFMHASVSGSIRFACGSLVGVSV